MRTLGRCLPSPAMVVAVVALFVAVGGTGYAASQLVHAPRAVGAKKHKKSKAKPTSTDDTSADNSLITSRAGGLSVAVAKTAGSADSATNAGHATSADHAASADSATNAGHATSADSATNAAHTTSADSATSAGHATSADSATNAGHATSADSAGSATTAGTLGGVQYVQSAAISNPSLTQSSGSVQCPGGTYVVGGGASGTSANHDQSINSSYPVKLNASAVPNGWHVDMNNGSNVNGYAFHVYAICAPLTNPTSF